MSEQSVFNQWMSRAIEKFKRRTPKSAKMFENAQKYLPGGDTRSIFFF